MRQLYISLFLILLFGCDTSTPENKNQTQSPSDKTYFNHLKYLVQLKNDVASVHWPEFSEKSTFSPLVYYTKEGSYVINPNRHITAITEHQEIQSIKWDAPIIRLSESYTDTLNFLFSNSYGDDSTELYYNDNVLFFSSFRLTQRFIPDIIDIQDWSIMVIHELFHSFQRSIPAHKAYLENLEIPDGPDSFLGSYHNDLIWYQESLKQENEILISIWKDGREVSSGLKLYDSLRTSRINRIQEAYGVDIREVEDYEIMMEGQARYFESLCKRFLAHTKTDTSMLEETDFSLITHMYSGYDLQNNEGLYSIRNNRYYYAIGFNISMILEQFYPEYKETIYKEEQNFNIYLKELMAK